MKLLVPSLETFSTKVPDVEVVHYDPTVSIPAEHTNADALVVWGMSNDLLAEAATRCERLRWVQLLSAGSDHAVTAGFSDQVTLTSGRSLHDEPVAEHALALILAAARRLHTMVRAQIGHRWASELGGVQPEPSPHGFSTLRGANVVIWGLGSIGGTLAPHLQALGANVTGIGTRARDERGVQVLTPADLPQILPKTDVLVMILPATADTQHALNADLIGLLPRDAWVVNVGRGSTIDEPALIRALTEGVIGGAALDVTAQEPLPASSSLWDLSNVIITPHAAGGRPRGAALLIEANLQALLNGSPLRNTVPSVRGTTP